jgi:hypothetical protein
LYGSVLLRLCLYILVIAIGTDVEFHALFGWLQCCCLILVVQWRFGFR